MGHKLEKKYGLLTAMCMVIGIVILIAVLLDRKCN